MRIILAVDDMPTRYGTFMRHCAQEDILLVVSDHPEYINMLLRNTPSGQILGICLDHDMPGRDAREIARESLVNYSIPVAIVSTNPDGSRDLSEILTEYAVPNARLLAGIGSSDWVERVIEYFEESNTETGRVVGA